MNLSNLTAPRGFKKRRKRLGRGDSSGHGGTSTRGHKGMKARAGAGKRIGYEGGQMPLARRLPKRGFHNLFKKNFACINVGLLNDLKTKDVDYDFLLREGYIHSSQDGLKVLGDGELKVAITVKAHCFTRSAIQKIEKAGGKAETLGAS